MKILMPISLLLLTAVAHAQYYDVDVQRVFDSVYNSPEYQYFIRNDTTREIAEYRYDHLYDSVEYAVVNAYIIKTLSEGTRFRWPHRVRKTYPSKTYWYLLKHKYNMDYGVSSGCVDEHSFRCFDSIMSREIKRKYGDDFFERTEAEAADLDKKGFGLSLPYIKGQKQNTMMLIRKAVPLIDTLQVLDFGQKSNVQYLLIFFKGNKLEDVNIGTMAWDIQPSLELMGYSEYLKEQLSKLDWVGPSFEGKPAEQTILVDFKEGTLAFR